MMPSRPSPLWPYLLVLVSLFTLTIAIPTWQSRTTALRSAEKPAIRQQSRSDGNERNVASVMIVRPVPASTPAPQSIVFSNAADNSSTESQTAGATQSGRTTLSGLFRGPLVEAVAQKIADLRRFRGQPFQSSKAKPPADRVIDFPITNISANPFPIANSLLSSPWSGSSAFNDSLGGFPHYGQQKSVLSPPVGTNDTATTTYWPLPVALIKQLDRLSQVADCAPWVDRTETICRDLSCLTPASGADAADLIGQLRAQVAQIDALLLQQTSPQAAVELRRVRYALQRRLAVWETSISPEHQSTVFANFVASDRPQTVVDTRQIFASIEQYECSGLASDARVVASAQQQLKYSSLDQDRNLAAQIDEHYRNANVRIAFTGELLGRLLPEPPPVSGVVNDRILGTPVRGVSDTTTQLQVRLIPDPHRIHFWLEARGVVDSRTAASRGPVTVNDRGESSYVVHKAVVIDENGMGLAKALAEADSNTQLIGINTRFDNRPLVSAVVRDRATVKYDKERASALCEVDQRVASQAGQRVDSEAKQALEGLESMIRQQMVSPLEKMGVDTQPVSFGTTGERVTMRIRLAGENQLGGHTARPQAPSDSLASIQVHESALNNVLDQLDLAGNTFTLHDLFVHLAARTSKPISVPDDLPDNVAITFAKHDPVHVRCQDGVIRVTLAVESLRQGSRIWNNFSISTTYAPEVDRLHARLVRSGPIELGGENYKGQSEVTLRGIFSTVLPRDRKLDLVPSLITDNARLRGLSLTQCVLDDGWIGIAIGPDRTAMRGHATGEDATTR